ncbi:hypothetical protein [Pantoea sp. GM01]|uniref:hypothetical protein n=1 Tax=Pantoea sp. GM01 TaxID=1144320 RepID=UPI000270F096|nr:hypothetical protein [Pantoea sp. GM01]EJL93167.1 hypothetical protein PMI17_00436 [Pantoea sp. GM01]
MNIEQSDFLSSISMDEFLFFKRIKLIEKARSSWEHFEELIYSLLDKAREGLSSSKDSFSYEETREDAYSDMLLPYLNKYDEHGLVAVREGKSAGHCDIVITLAGFKWLGEAKKASGYEHIFSGFLQLCNRYSSCHSNSKSGGVLLYCGQQKVNLVMNRWMTHLSENYVEAISYQNDKNDENIKYTTHLHTESGTEYKVIHYPFYLHHKPLD